MKEHLLIAPLRQQTDYLRQGCIAHRNDISIGLGRHLFHSIHGDATYPLSQLLGRLDGTAKHLYNLMTTPMQRHSQICGQSTCAYEDDIHILVLVQMHAVPLQLVFVLRFALISLMSESNHTEHRQVLGNIQNATNHGVGACAV